jgi:hypothetical protein
MPKSSSGIVRGNKSITCVLVGLFFLAPGMALSQDANQTHTLIINGQSTQVPVVQVSGRSYVDLEELASAVSGSLSFAGSQIALNIPLRSATTGAAATAPKPMSAPPPTSNSGFSKGFLNAGIEEAATLREWHAALASAIQNGYPVTDNLLAPYRAQATTKLRLVSIAVSTDSDREAYQLLNNLFQNMARLSDEYIAMRTNMTYIAPDALRNDSLNQRIVACGHSLGAMAASGQFSDDGSCH